MSIARTLPTAEELRRQWRDSPRWRGIRRGYDAKDVVRLRGTIAVEHSIARLTAEKLWHYLGEREFVNALGALTGNQAMQQVKAGLDAIYLSGWQVAGDANLAGEMYPDQSLYPADSVPAVVRRINNTLRRADEIHHAEGDDSIDWLKPIVADAEAGFGGVLNAFELMKQMIEAGAAGVHFEDQLSSAKKCGHMGGKVLVPTQEAINKLTAARLAADVCNVPTVLIARTDAEGANLLTSDIDERDRGARSHGGRLLRGQGGPQGGDRPRPRLRTVRGPCVVRDRQARSRGGPRIRRGHSRAVPRQAAGLQLLTLVQLEAQAR
jgi:isocitrate lyase